MTQFTFEKKINKIETKPKHLNKKELDNPRLKSKMHYKCHNVALVLLHINNSNMWAQAMSKANSPVELFFSPCYLKALGENLSHSLCIN